MECDVYVAIWARVSQLLFRVSKGDPFPDDGEDFLHYILLAKNGRASLVARIIVSAQSLSENESEALQAKT